MVAKRCPVCGGAPQFVYYTIPGSMNDPDDLYALLKRLECKNCGASVSWLVMTCDDAVTYWNATNPNTGKRYVLERVGTEDCEVEPNEQADRT